MQVNVVLVAVVLAAACGSGSRPPTAPPPDQGVAAVVDAPPPAPKGMLAGDFDVALDFPKEHLVKVEADGIGYSWGATFVDIGHTDGRMTNFIAVRRGGIARDLATEIRGELAKVNTCGPVEDADFLGRPGARFACQMGDAWGIWYLSAAPHCFWSVMISRNGEIANVQAQVEAILPRITVASGGPRPDVAGCAD
jgi:hypothetical protein